MLDYIWEILGLNVKSNNDSLSLFWKRIKISLLYNKLRVK